MCYFTTYKVFLIWLYKYISLHIPLSHVVYDHVLQTCQFNLTATYVSIFTLTVWVICVVQDNWHFHCSWHLSSHCTPLIHSFPQLPPVYIARNWHNKMITVDRIDIHNHIRTASSEAVEVRHDNITSTVPGTTNISEWPFWLTQLTTWQLYTNGPLGCQSCF